MSKVLERLAAERERASEQVNDTLAAIEVDERDPSDAERALIARQRERIAELEPQITELVEWEEQQANSRDVHAVLNRSRVTVTVDDTPGSPQRPGQPVLHRSAGEFIVDMLRARGGMRDLHGQLAAPDSTALERMAPWLSRIENQTTADTPGILPEPIIGPVIGALTAVQPFISSIGGTRPMGGIPGKTFSRPKITQHTLVGVQTAEKGEFPSRKMVIGSVPMTKVTKGGSVDISRQDIDWTVPSAWDILLGDLAAVYGEEVEEEAAAAVAAAATVNTPVVVAANTLDAWAAALYEAAATVFLATTPKRLPDRIWMSVDVWAQYGPVVDVAIVRAGQQLAELVSTQGVAGFGGNVFALPRFVVPGFPAGTCMIGHSSDFEVYEEVVGLLTAVEPSIFGVQVAYGGYVAFGAVTPEGLCKLTPPASALTLTGLTPDEIEIES